MLSCSVVLCGREKVESKEKIESKEKMGSNSRHLEVLSNEVLYSVASEKVESQNRH